MTPPPLITLYVKNDPIDKIFMCLTLPLMIFSNYFQCGSSFLKESFKMNAHTLRTFGKVWAGPGIMPDHKDPITLDTIIDDQDAEWVPGEITGYLRYKLGDELDDDLDWMLNGRRAMDKCTVCGEEFDLDYEGVDIDDKVFCDECQYEYTYRCPVCEGAELEDRRGDIGSALILEDVANYDIGLENGVYEIIRHPYYGGSIIGSNKIFPHAVRRLGDLPTGANEMDMGGYPCAHVCRDCDADVKRRAILFQKFT